MIKEDGNQNEEIKLIKNEEIPEDKIYFLPEIDYGSFKLGCETSKCYRCCQKYKLLNRVQQCN